MCGDQECFSSHVKKAFGNDYLLAGVLGIVGMFMVGFGAPYNQTPCLEETDGSMSAVLEAAKHATGNSQIVLDAQKNKLSSLELRNEMRVKMWEKRFQAESVVPFQFESGLFASGIFMTIAAGFVTIRRVCLECPK